MIDVLSFLALADKSLGLSFSRQTHSLGNAVDIVTPIDPVSGYGQWKHIKNVRGWPWDLKLYDANFVYDWVTEGKDGWSTDPLIGPKSFKKFVANHFVGSALADGLLMLPRMIDPQHNNFAQTIPALRTKYATFSACQEVGTPVSLGTVTQRLSGPFLIDHGGDVGPQPTLIHQYYWSNNGVPTLEENYFALHYGWVAWKLQVLDTGTGLYKTVKSTINNTLKLLTAPPMIVFPCF
jgi:hypothetical protein